MTVAPTLGPEQVRAVQSALVHWYQAEGRNLPWRHTRDPYAVLVSEVMLQQTQVERVLPKWRAWLEQFPTLEALAGASRAEVIRAWQGLGYNLRAVRLHEIARQAVDRFGGALPGSQADLLGLKGIGRYTAGAVACFAFGEHVAFVDTNVRRVLGRVFLGDPLAEPRREREIAALAEAVLPEDSYAWNQGLMDLGATICTVARPACLVCPVRDVCLAAPTMTAWPEERQRRLQEARATYDTSARQRSAARRMLRGRLVDVLREQPHGTRLGQSMLAEMATSDAGVLDAEDARAEIARLVADGLLVLHPAVAGEGVESLVALPD